MTRNAVRYITGKTTSESSAAEAVPPTITTAIGARLVLVLVTMGG